MLKSLRRHEKTIASGNEVRRTTEGRPELRYHSRLRFWQPSLTQIKPYYLNPNCTEKMSCLSQKMALNIITIATLSQES